MPVVERNSVLPEKIPDGRLIVLRDGDRGEPEQAPTLGGLASASPTAGLSEALRRSPVRWRSTQRRSLWPSTTRATPLSPDH
jgi:hypothetical protein